MFILEIGMEFLQQLANKTKMSKAFWAIVLVHEGGLIPKNPNPP